MRSSSLQRNAAPPVFAFIGWHNSGKTTLARHVLACLKAKGYRVGIIKSTKECGIVVEPPQADTALYKAAGADGVALLAPDQLIVHLKPLMVDLHTLALHLFPEVDLVLAEGFKHSADVPKIEVRRDPTSPLLRDLVPGVMALVCDLSDLSLAGEVCFRFDQIHEITDYIEIHLFGTKRPAAAHDDNPAPGRQSI